MQPPYYAVIFTSKRKQYTDDYDKTAERMKELSTAQPGFLGITSARNEDGEGITVCYWERLEAIKNWKENAEHQEAQMMGKKEWYESYSLRVAKVEKEYSWETI